MTQSPTLIIALMFAMAPLLLVNSDSCRSSSQHTSVSQSALNGTWGGEHIQLEIGNKEITIEWDCADGTITPPLHIDQHGNFQAKGTFRREHGGPIRNDEATAPAAQYSGSIGGNKMTLTVRLAKSSEPIGTYTLEHWMEGHVVKCR